MRRMVEERHNVAFMVGVILGGLGGALATLFLTPLSGEQTREQLRARLAGLQPGGRLPDHLDRGTYASADEGETGAGKSSLRERVRELAGGREKVAELVPGRDERDEAPVDGAVTYTPAANETARRGMERLDEAEARAEATTAPPPGGQA